MSIRPVAATLGILALALVTSWGASRWRLARAERPDGEVGLAASAADHSRAVAALDGIPGYRGLLGPEDLRGAHVAADGSVSVEVDPRAAARRRASARAHPSLIGLLPAVARGRVETRGSAPVSESWTLSCPDGCALDLLDATPPEGSPSAAWPIRPESGDAIAWFAIDARRLADPALGGASLAPLRERVDAVERLLDRPIRAELAAALAGTGIVVVEDREPPHAPRVLVALDLARPDRMSALVDLVVSLAVVAGRGEVRHHRDVRIAVLGDGIRGATLAVDGPLLLVSTETVAVASAIDRRRGMGAVSAGAPAGFARFDGSWRAENGSAFVGNAWSSILGTPVPPPKARVTATLAREGEIWRLEGHGSSAALTAEPVLPVLRAWLSGG